MAKKFVKYFPQVIRRLFNDPSSSAERQLRQRAEAVKRQAQKNLLRPPGGFDTGRLSASIEVVRTTEGGVVAYRVGTKLPYAGYVHNGTGIYGPRGQMIKPAHAKALRWRGPGGDVIFAKQVKGMKPNPFLRDALHALQS